MNRNLTIALSLALSLSFVPANTVQAAEAGQEVSISVEEASSGNTAEDDKNDTCDDNSADTVENSKAAANEGTTSEDAAAADTASDSDEITSVPSDSPDRYAADDDASSPLPAASDRDDTEDAADQAADLNMKGDTSSEPSDNGAEAIDNASYGLSDEIVEAQSVTDARENAGMVTDGFVTEDGKRYYYEGGIKKTGWITYKNATYYMMPDGEMAVGLTYISGEGTFYFMDSTYKAFNPSREGQMLTGWKTVDGAVRYFKDGKSAAGVRTGKMLTGWRSIGGYRYYLADAKTKGFKTGERLTGWQTISGKVYYFADDDYPSRPVGTQLTGFKTIGGNRYYLADSRYKGLPTGARATGWRTISGKKYYFVSANYPYSKVTGKMLTGIKTINGKAYYFGSNGVRRTGWVKTPDGRMAYYTSSGPAGKAGWRHRDDDGWYYLAKNGKAKVGWLRLSSYQIYYLDKKAYGRMVDSPTRINGKIYFFDSEGRRAVTEGWKDYGNNRYYTYKNGRVAVDTTIDGIKVDGEGRAQLSGMDLKAQNYSSSTDYLILVNKSEHKVCIYHWENGFWKRIRSCYCGDGKPSTPTVEGSFTVGIKMLYFDSGSARCWYATQFYGNYLFHTVLYYRDSAPRSVMDGRVGVGVSHGCVRLQIENARWIYNNIPRGTKVVVYR